MFRLYFLTFEGKYRFSSEKHPHESPKIMTVPLMVLAGLSIIGGFIGIPEIFSGEHGNQFHNWLAPIFKSAERKLITYGSHSHFEEILLMVVSVIGAAGSIYFARYIYTQKSSIAVQISKRFSKGYNLLWNKYFVDEFYNIAIIRPIRFISEKFLWKIFDATVIDGGMVHGTGRLIVMWNRALSRIQNGIIQQYLAFFLVGVILILWMLLY